MATSVRHKTESILQGALKAIIQGLTEFATDDVTINDWNMLDQPMNQSPYFIVKTSEEFTVREMDGTWVIQGQLIVGFEDMQAYTELQNARQEIIDTFTDPASSASTLGLDGVQVTEIRALSGILPLYADNEGSLATPVFIYQEIAFNVETF